MDKYKKLKNEMEELYNMLYKVSIHAPNVICNTTLDNIFSNITSLIFAFEEAGIEDGLLPSINIVKIIFVADGDFEDVEDMRTNLKEQYPEFSGEETSFVVEEYEDNSKKHYKICLEGIWFGNIEECKRLEHHAEGLYENTGFENVHVEVIEK